MYRCQWYSGTDRVVVKKRKNFAKFTKTRIAQKVRCSSEIKQLQSVVQCHCQKCQLLRLLTLLSNAECTIQAVVLLILSRLCSTPSNDNDRLFKAINQQYIDIELGHQSLNELTMQNITKAETFSNANDDIYTCSAVSTAGASPDGGCL